VSSAVKAPTAPISARTSSRWCGRWQTSTSNCQLPKRLVLGAGSWRLGVDARFFVPRESSEGRPFYIPNPPGDRFSTRSGGNGRVMHRTPRAKQARIRRIGASCGLAVPLLLSRARHHESGFGCVRQLLSASVCVVSRCRF
jgi:hypothetical protein